MKKILLSVIALFAAISVNAQTAVDITSIGAVGSPISFSGGWEWKGQMLSTGDLVSDEAAGTVDDSGVTYFDASAYDYLAIKYTSTSDKIKMIIEYNATGKIGQWGPEHNSADVQLKVATDEYAYIQLSEFKNTISQIAFQDMGEAVELTISEIFLATTAELEAILTGEAPAEEPTEEPVAPSGNAIVISVNVDNELGLDAENGTSLIGGTALYEGEIGTLAIGADDTYKPQDVQALVNDGTLAGGLQGGSNSKDADGDFPNNSLQVPVSGAFNTWEAKKTGYLYVIHKASSNKAYTVFEEGTCIGYTFAAVGDAETDLGAVYQYTLQGEGEFNEVKNPIEWAEREYLKANNPDAYAAHLSTDETGAETWDKIAKNGIGVIVFPVFADCKYVFNANGSKMTIGGIAFSEADDLTIKTTDGVQIYAGGGETAIQGAKVVTVAGNGAIYNLAGQKVDAAYKGIVIKDGKKFIQK